jgi:1-acyl-sn-glycerol-3-phosphate acyltransferase
MVAVQYSSWLISQLLRCRFVMRVHIPAGLFEDRARRRLIIAPTHGSFIDPWLLALALRWHQMRSLVPVRILATQTLGRLAPFKPLIGLLYRLAGVLALPPRTAGGSLTEKVLGLVEALDHGDAVVIFPEGHVRHHEASSIGPFARGVVHVHRESGAPVVPVAIRRGERGRVRRICVIEVGPPVNIPASLDLEQGACWLRAHTLALHEQAGAHASRTTSTEQGADRVISRATLPR